MRLWDKGKPVDKHILKFTVGEDYQLDLRLVRYDCIASQAHARMLNKIGVLTEEETETLTKGLLEIIASVEKKKFKILSEQEDCHTAIEKYLTDKYGEVGKKIHLGRSRNDQVLTALRLCEKEMLLHLKEVLSEFREVLGSVIQASGKTPIPGYTHTRKAMPATIGMWLGSFDEAAADDLRILELVFKVIDQSPLGTAAGFGTPVYRLDRRMTAKELGFASIQKNPFYAQFSRGKFETYIMALFSGVMLTLNKLATDLLIFSMDEFAFVVLPEAFCTGSSVMPHKKNPDVLELIRANYSVVLGEEFKIKSLVANLMSGYNRDMQLTKKPLFCAYDTVLSCIDMMNLILPGLQIDEEKCKAALTEDLFATEEAYSLVKKGMSFRDAYRKVAEKYTK